MTVIIDNKVKLTPASGGDDANACNLTVRGRKGAQIPTMKSGLEASDKKKYHDIFFIKI